MFISSEIAQFPKKIKKQLIQRFNKLSGKTYSKNRKKPIVFIFGTGRSGSQAIIKTLNQHSKIMGFHEQLRPLIQLSTELAAKPKDKRILKEIQKVFDYQLYPGRNNEVIIHSDQRFWNLVPFLKEYFPNAKYILLIREPVACIKSFVSRNIFQDNEYPDFNTHPWAKYRLSGPITGEISEDIWSQMTPIERAAWYWCYINASVKADFKKLLPETDYLILETEEMGVKLKEIQRFIGVPEESIGLKITNKRKKNDDARFQKLDDETVIRALRKIEEMKPDYLGLHSDQRNSFF